MIRLAAGRPPPPRRNLGPRGLRWVLQLGQGFVDPLWKSRPGSSGDCMPPDARVRLAVPRINLDRIEGVPEPLDHRLIGFADGCGVCGVQLLEVALEPRAPEAIARTVLELEPQWDDAGGLEQLRQLLGVCRARRRVRARVGLPDRRR